MVARFPAQISKLRPRLPATGRHSTSDLTFQPADALSPFDSALLPRAEARGAHSVALSPLDSALTESAPASPLECALTKTPGVWGSYFPPLPTFRPSDLQTLDVLLSPLCFHILTNCFSRNSLLFTTIRIAQGCTPPTLPSSVFCFQPPASTHEFSRTSGASLPSWCSFPQSLPLFSTICSLFSQNPGWGYPLAFKRPDAPSASQSNSWTRRESTKTPGAGDVSTGRPDRPSDLQTGGYDQGREM